MKRSKKVVKPKKAAGQVHVNVMQSAVGTVMTVNKRCFVSLLPTPNDRKMLAAEPRPRSGNGHDNPQCVHTCRFPLERHKRSAAVASANERPLSRSAAHLVRLPGLANPPQMKFRDMVRKDGFE